MVSKLYVGNLNFDTTEEQLQTLFSEIGPIASVALITDKRSGESKGFAFVEMQTDAAAQEAITRLNNRELGGRNIKVSEARPRDPDKDSRPPRRDQQSRGAPRRRY